MKKSNLKPEEEELEDGLETTDQQDDLEESLPENRRKRRKIKVRRRIRIKKRTSPKKKAIKTLETIAWVVIVAAFMTVLVILILQLDLNDKRTKKYLGKPVSMVESKVYGFPFTVAEARNYQL